MKKFITILSFSSRKDGNCGKISEYLSQYYAKENLRSYRIDAEIFAPCGNCDYQCLKPGVSCPGLTPEQTGVMDAICESDLVYFIVPNYCGYPCANYFAFNERSVGYFDLDRERMERYMSVRKRFIIVSNSEGFEEPMRQQSSDPEILYLKSGKYGKRSIAGDLLDSEDAKSELSEFLSKFSFDEFNS